MSLRIILDTRKNDNKAAYIHRQIILMKKQMGQDLKYK